MPGSDISLITVGCVLRVWCEYRMLSNRTMFGEYACESYCGVPHYRMKAFDCQKLVFLVLKRSAYDDYVGFVDLKTDRGSLRVWDGDEFRILAQR